MQKGAKKYGSVVVFEENHYLCSQTAYRSNILLSTFLCNN